MFLELSKMFSRSTPFSKQVQMEKVKEVILLKMLTLYMNLFAFELVIQKCCAKAFRTNGICD